MVGAHDWSKLIQAPGHHKEDKCCFGGETVFKHVLHILFKLLKQIEFIIIQMSVKKKKKRTLPYEEYQ